MKKFIINVIAFVAVTSLVFAGSGQKTFPLAQGKAPSKIVTTFANSEIDTFIINVESGVTQYTFGVHAKDSVAFGRTAPACQIVRVVDGTAQAAVATDTLAFSSLTSTVDGNSASIAFANGSAYAKSITVTPFTSQILVILKYHSSGNGVTTPTAVYELNKQFYVK